jgi:hypothetical protein
VAYFKVISEHFLGGMEKPTNTGLVLETRTADIQSTKLQCWTNRPAE